MFLRASATGGAAIGTVSRGELTSGASLSAKASGYRFAEDYPPTYHDVVSLGGTAQKICFGFEIEDLPYHLRHENLNNDLVRQSLLSAIRCAMALCAECRGEVTSGLEVCGKCARVRLNKRVVHLRNALETNRSEQATLFECCVASMKRVAKWSLALALFPGFGLMIHMFLIPAIGRSPAGVVCPLVCSSCTSPARTYSWSYSGSWRSGNGTMGYAFICTNPEIDTADLDKMAIIRSLNARLQPYMLNSFVVWMTETAVCVPLITLVLGALFGVRRRRRILDQKPQLEQLETNLASAEAALRAFDASG